MHLKPRLHTKCVIDEPHVCGTRLDMMVFMCVRVCMCMCVRMITCVCMSARVYVYACACNKTEPILSLETFIFFKLKQTSLVCHLELLRI